MNDLHTRVSNLKELKESGWKSLSVKDELRKNIIERVKSGEEMFPGILGYEKTVLPQVQHAIMSKHDVILLGLRGQAKTRILRALVQFLDEYIPIVKGSVINDDLFTNNAFNQNYFFAILIKFIIYTYFLLKTYILFIIPH